MDRSGLRRARRRIATKKKNIRNRVGELCRRDDQKVVMKRLITPDNFRELKQILKEMGVNIERKGGGTYSYRQYCKLFDSFILKDRICGNRICCQAITEDGKRCTRGSMKFVYDMTEKQMMEKLPLFLQRKLTAKQKQNLKLLGFANSCCFFCWQHAAIMIARTTAEYATWTSNLWYYTAHIDILVNIFYEQVEVKKLGPYTINITGVSGLRSPDEIVKYLIKTKGDTIGMVGGTQNILKGSTTYWALWLMVFAYDKLKSALIDAGLGKKDIENMSEQSAQALLNLTI